MTIAVAAGDDGSVAARVVDDMAGVVAVVMSISAGAVGGAGVVERGEGGVVGGGVAGDDKSAGVIEIEEVERVGAGVVKGDVGGAVGPEGGVSVAGGGEASDGQIVAGRLTEVDVAGGVGGEWRKVEYTVRAERDAVEVNARGGGPVGGNEIGD